MDQTIPEPSPGASAAAEVPPEPAIEVCARPASDWLREVELQIKTLSAQRQEVRRKLGTELEQLRALHPRGEERFSVHDARGLAKSEVLGAQWQQASERVHYARQRLLSARRQLHALSIVARATQERARGWTYWIFHAPRHALKARPLRKRLREANAQRREALRTVQPLRSLLVLPDVRSKIVRLTEDLLLKEERLTHSVQSRREIDRKLTEKLAPALGLAPRLRDLGAEMVAMQRPTDIARQQVTLPVPVEPLCAPSLAPHPSQGLRPR